MTACANITSSSAGCLNGGGQIKATETENSKDLLKEVTGLYKTPPDCEPGSSPLVDRLYLDWLHGNNSDKVKKVLYTNYHEVEKMSSALTIKW